VRYYSAWVEKGDGNALVSAEIHDDEQDAWTIPSSTNGTTGTSIKVEKENPTCHLCHMTYKDWEVSFEHWGLIDSVLQPMDLCIPCYLKSVPNSVDATKISIRQKEIFSDYLFILMEYCEKTLQDAVKGATKEVIWDYFGQCLKGVSYLHSKQIIHRDIKPNNIFVKDLVVKIGDFGLSKIFNKAAASAAGVISRVPSNDDDDATVGSKSSQVGTFLYMAPEVEVGRPCNEKCDVYSLGILLVEIFSNFSTAMERAHVLSSNLRNLPQEWIDQHPVQAQLAQIMVGTSPKNRPSCDEVLGELVQRGILAESVLRNDESTQSALAAQVVQLQAALACSQKEVDRLRRLLDEHGIQHTSDQEHR
jgi:serine/threonine protein kinase